MKKITKAIIPAAGVGTRFLPATKVIPKEMIPIIDKPMIQFVIEECVGAGIHDIILITAPEKEATIQHFNPSPSLENFLHQRKKEDTLQMIKALSQMAKITPIIQEEPLGLGHAILIAQNMIHDEPFAVLLADDLVDSQIPCIKQLIDVFEKHQKSVIGVMKVAPEEVSKYGMIGGKNISSKLITVDTMVEKPTPEDTPSLFACPGRYVLTPHIFKFLSQVKPNRDREIQLTDALCQLAKEEGLLAYLFDGTRYDTGDKLGFIKATIALALKRPNLAASVRKMLSEFKE